MALNIGTRIGSYEIVSAVGAGGMGEVYRARDPKLNRDVAIKVLPDLFVSDPERVARFSREAQLLAAFNHPHIAAIYGFEEVASTKFLVLEFVDGQSLADKLAKSRTKGLPVGEVLAIARQIADALEAAHEKGIIHRDLKPANIMLTGDDHVKVLDFGLAKLQDSGAGRPGGAGGIEDVDVTNSPTLTLGATQAGVILGTAAYMAPEQAKGRAADKRSDIWAFGCVVYEMLTGHRAFEGEDISDTLANVLKSEPDWNALPSDAPANIRELLKRCLTKDRKARVADASTIRYVLDGPIGPTASAPSQKRPEARGFAIAVLAAAAIAASGTWFLTRPAPAPPPHAIRFAIVPPSSQPLTFANPEPAIAISPDGSRIAYIATNATGQAQLFVRSLDRLDATTFPGLESARNPFFSPDGRWIGFFQVEGGLKKIAVTGGPAFPLCPVIGAPRGASWGDDDRIVFATNDTGTGLLSVPAGGGEPKVLTKPDLAHEGDHTFPSVLPGARGVLFTKASVSDAGQVAVLDLKSGQSKTLIRGGSHAQYVSSGHIVYAAAGALRAVQFDLSRLDVIGDPFPIADAVLITPLGAAQFSASKNGTAVYAPGGTAAFARSLVWVDRQGHEEPIKAAPPRGYVYPRLSPDGSRIVVDIREATTGLSIWNVETGNLMPLTNGGDQYPIWTPDGHRIVFGRSTGGNFSLYSLPADGTGAADRLTHTEFSEYPETFAPDGSLVIQEARQNTNRDLLRLRLDAKSDKNALETLIDTAGTDSNATVSPDGHWMAYQTNFAGHDDIYVQSFPDPKQGRKLLSTAGGTRPLWSRTGKEIFYIDPTGGFISVAVLQTAQGFAFGKPQKLFDAHWLYTTTPGRPYDSIDGQRFVMVKDTGTTDPNATPASLVVVTNWLEELKAKSGKP
jgi:serine/threonine-protein kinase